MAISWVWCLWQWRLAYFDLQYLQYIYQRTCFLSLCKPYTLWVRKNWATFIFTVTLANVGGFLKFFRCRNQKEMAHNKNEKISHRNLTLLLHYLVKLTLVWLFKATSAHCARETMEVLRRETPDFISSDLWPPNSPDLNPVDYETWAVMQRRVYHRKIHTIDELRQRLIEVWCGLEWLTVNIAIDQWRKRLKSLCSCERRTLRT